MNFKRIRVRDLLLVDHEGTVVEGTWPVNEAAFMIHSHVLRSPSRRGRRRPLASIYGKAFSSLHRPLEPFTQDACAFYGDHAVVTDYGGVVLEHEEGTRIAAALGRGKAAILANHGLLTVGQTVDEAAWWFITMERSCQAQLVAEAAGKPVPIDHDEAVRTAGQVGNRGAGRFSFQPLYDWIVHEQPDLLDE